MKERMFSVDRAQKALAFLTCAVSVLIGHAFTVGMYEASIVWPAIGFAFGFLFVYRQSDMTVAVFLGLYTGYHVSGQFFIGTEELGIVIMRGFLSSFTTVFAIILVREGIFRFFDFCWRLQRKNILLAVGSAFVISLFASIFGNSVLLLVGLLAWTEFWPSFLIWTAGDFLGIMNFGIPLALALIMDKRPSLPSFSLWEVGFYLVLATFSFLIYSEAVPVLNYADHKFLFFPFVVVAAIYFPFRSLVVGSFIFLAMMALRPPFPAEIGHLDYTLDVNILLIVVTVTFLTIRVVGMGLEKEQKELLDKKERLGQLVESMENLFMLSNEGPVEEKDRAEILTARIFRMIYRLFNRIDYGSCLIIERGELRYIDAVGYDIDYLNSIRFDIETWKAQLDEPLHMKNMEKRLRKSLGKHYDEYALRNPAIKEAVMMSVKIGAGLYCEMSFDIRKESDENFTPNILDYFKTLNNLLNGFFEAETSIYEHDEMKSHLVESLLKTIALLDPDMHRHSKRVAALAQEFAKAAFSDEKSVSELFWAGIMHDIGKVGIPENIVQKKGRLTVSEYEKMKGHADLGASLLSASDVLGEISTYVRHHHERYDGTGYPDGLKGDEIPYETAILAVAEAVIAMMEDYSFSPAMTPEDIVRELHRERGRQFHPKAVDLAIEMIEDDLLADITEEE